MVATDFKLKKLDYGSITCSSSPRRISVLVEGLPPKAPDFIDQRKGPPAANAYKDGQPTSAAIGFAKRYGVLPENLLIKKTSKGDFVFAEILEVGLTTQDLLVELIPKWIDDLQGKRFMRWGVGSLRFSRPIRWLVCLLDKSILPIELSNIDPKIKSSNITRGHRLFNQAITIAEPKKYINLLKDSGVIINRKDRLNLIKSLVEKESLSLKAYPDLPENLLEELTDIVESPFLIKGQFNSSFLELPPEVLINVMQVHQRYIPLYSSNEEKDPLLLNSKNTLESSFFCISNGLQDSSENITNGNQRVLIARFSDAKFFIDIDLAIKSKQRREKLSNVAFAEGLGTLLNRVERIEWIASKLSNFIGISSSEASHLNKAAYYSKHDLVSQIVSEFPELQGVIGGKYLLFEGEDRKVALAVYEHYLPKGAGDFLPSSLIGSLLAISDKMEILLSIFAKGERPTGSSDPYALRRAANGILQIIWDKDLQFDFATFIDQASTYWQSLFPAFNISNSRLSLEIKHFFQSRIVSLLEEMSFDYDLVQAVSGKSLKIDTLLTDLTEISNKANLLVEMRASGRLSSLHSVVTRASRLAAKGNLDLEVLSSENIVNPQLFEKQSEVKLFELLNKIEPIVKSSDRDRHRLLAECLESGNETLANFFDGPESVMVMVEDKKIRDNRLNLLSILRNQAFTIADFDLIKA
ncbi:Glycyl-tRNA synthetase beta chain [Prochlorococcus sp. MIT 0601]|nr:Glycyl-tRNA synthetase beta chain [Prochlorococcus sp. MIT 0601]